MLASRGPMDAPPDADLIARARTERVHLLLAARLGVTRDHAAGLTDHVAARLVAETRVAAVDDAARGRELVRVVERLESRGCAPVVFKGAALAYTHYEQPWLRPRIDVDVLVAEAQRHVASREFLDLGYTRPPFVSGQLVMYQEPFVRAEPGGLEHVFDLHWRVSNPQAVSRVLSHAEIAARSIAGRPAWLALARAVSGRCARAGMCASRGASPGRPGSAVAVRHPSRREPAGGARMASRPGNSECRQGCGALRPGTQAGGRSVRHRGAGFRGRGASRRAHPTSRRRCSCSPR